MKRILPVIISVLAMIAVAAIFFVFHAKEPKSKRCMNSLADVDVTQKNISYEDLCAIVKVCTENGGCSMDDWKAYLNGNTRKGYWTVAGSNILTTPVTNERLVQAGYFDIARKYKSLHSL